MKVLNSINAPEDLKKLTHKELDKLCSEIRNQIIYTCSENGGHLGASLGTVELSVALHKVFNSPNNPIVWDVGHQTYAHKLLTGRRERFSTIRKKGGISGFTKRSESPHDPFGAGHASTSISAALGIAEAKKQKGKNDWVIAVVGDGAITGGLCFEGLNNAGHLKTKNLLVILNDNEMSIAPNVGALSEYFKRIVGQRNQSALYTYSRNQIKSLFKRWDDHHPNFLPSLRRLRTAAKNLAGIGGLFEDLGFRYLGPMDGHDLPALLETFENIQNTQSDHPILLHLITQKGKGFSRAEKEPSWSHGPSPYNPKTGESLPKAASAKTYTEVFSEAITKIADTDPDVIAITAAMPGGTGLSKFKNIHPERFYDVGIAEQHAVVFAAGLAAEGKKPLAAIYSTFMQRAYDGMIHDVALQNLPVVFALDRSGLVGSDGPTHHGAFDISFMRAVPNLTIYVPRDENQLQHQLYSAFNLGVPVALRYPRGAGVGVNLDSEFRHINPGSAEILHGENHEAVDLCIWGVGPILYSALKACEELEIQGYKLQLVDARTVKPLDLKLLDECAVKSKAMITLEENTVKGGFGSAVSEALNTLSHKLPLRLIGIPDRFIPQGSPKGLYRDLDLDTEGLKKSFLELLEENATPLSSVQPMGLQEPKEISHTLQ